MEERQDLINRQAAIDEIEERKNANGYRNVAVISELNRLEGYIMRLPSAQPVDKDIDVTSNDCISRQMLLEYIHGEPVGKLLCDKYNLDGLIEQFPSAQPNFDITVKIDKAYDDGYETGYLQGRHDWGDLDE